MKKFIISLFIICFISNKNFSQNVAINATGAIPNISAMLDIASTTSGLLVPRMTTALRTAIGTPATGLVVYDTTTGGFWYFNGTVWVQLLNATTGWALVGNTLAGTEILGSTNAQPVRVFSNNIERMRILTAGQVAVNSTVTFGTSTFYSQATGNNSAIDGNAAGTGNAVYGQNTGTGFGVNGLSTNATAMGTAGYNTNASGTGGIFSGNNGTPNYLVAGSGVAATGLSTGGYFFSTTGGIGQSIYTSQFGNIVRLNYWSGATQFKVNGTGTMPAACTVKDLNGNEVEMYSSESPDFVFNDFGEGELKNGKTHIDLDPIYAKSVVIDRKHPLRVFVQLEGNCKGVFVTNKTETGFDVEELDNGTSNTTFQWQVICNVKDVKRPDGTINHLQDIRYAPANLLLETGTTIKPEVKNINNK